MVKKLVVFILAKFTKQNSHVEKLKKFVGRIFQIVSKKFDDD